MDIGEPKITGGEANHTDKEAHVSREKDEKLDQNATEMDKFQITQE